MILDPADMRLIHEKSLELLESPGIRIDHRGFLDSLESIGARIDRERSVAHIPPEVTDRAVRATARRPCLLLDEPETVQAALSDRMSETLSKPLRFAFGGSALEVLSADGRTARTAGYDDLERVIRFGNGHPGIARVGGPPVQCAFERDGTVVPPTLRPVAGMRYAAKHCAKPGWNEIANVDDVRFAVKLGELLAGSETAFRRNPFFLCVKCSVSPLAIAADSASILYELARRGLPVGLAPMPLSGGTAPVTPAASILTTNTEILGILTAIYAVGSRSPHEHLPLSGVMDMQTTIASFSSPNTALQDIGAVQLLITYYGLPADATTDYIDAKFPGHQSGNERALKIATSLMSGSLYPSVGQLKSGLLCSCEQALLDIEAFDWMCRFLRGVEVTEETLAVDLIRQEGIGGNFLGADHTVKRFRDELFAPRFADRSAALARDSVASAIEEVERIIREHPVWSRDESLCREIDRLYAEEVARRETFRT
jgi:trimethylamine---corrinoid protein Co-methyltransferase